MNLVGIELNGLYVTACGYIIKMVNTHEMKDGTVGFVGTQMYRHRDGTLEEDAAGWHYDRLGGHQYGDEGLNIIGRFVERDGY